MKTITFDFVRQFTFGQYFETVDDFGGPFGLKWAVIGWSTFIESKYFLGVNDPSGDELQYDYLYRYLPVKLCLINHENNNQLTLYTDYNLLIYKSEMSLICHPYTKEWTLEESTLDHPTKC